MIELEFWILLFIRNSLEYNNTLRLAEKEMLYQQQIKEYQLKIEQITQQHQHV